MSGLQWNKNRQKAKAATGLNLFDETEYRGRDDAARFIAAKDSKKSNRRKASKAANPKGAAKAMAAYANHIFTDGACEPNPGVGGWGFVVFEHGLETNNRNGGDAETTNNIMEMTAVLAALEYAKQVGFSPSATVIFSDSQYVVKGCTEWRKGWKAKGWTRGADKPLANSGLWQAIDKAIEDFPCAIIWVRGHSGVPGNERADELAEKGRSYVLRSAA